MKRRVRPHIDRAVSAFDNTCLPYYADVDLGVGDFFCKICKRIQSTRFGIYDISASNAPNSVFGRLLPKRQAPNPNVMLELGMSLAFGKKAVIIMRTGQKPPSDLSRTEIVFYSTPDDLENKLAEKIPKVVGG